MTRVLSRFSQLISLLLLLTLATPANADRSSEAVLIPTDVTFGSVRVRTGIYLVRETPDGSIELESTIDGSTVQVRAERGRHTQSIGSQLSIAVQANSNQVHVMVLSPDGTQRRAVGVRGQSGRARPVDTPVASVRAEVQRAEGRLPQLAGPSSQVVRPAPSVTGARVAQQRYQQAVAAAQEEEEAAAAAEEDSAADYEETIEYTFNVPLNLQSMPASVEHVNIWIMLGTAPWSDDATGTSVGGGGQPVGWGQATVDLPGNGMLQHAVAVPVDWYGPGPSGSGDIVPFPTHYVVYITLGPVAGPKECGTNSNWESQARCGTPLRTRVTGALPGQ